MSIPLLVYYVLAKMMSAIESAPLGNGIFDPLVSSVELSNGDKLSNEMALSIFRRKIPPEEIINTGKYEGYIFNQNRCIQFNNRILCGYDRNKGVQLDDYTMIDIGSGCRARGDRVECGYANPTRINTNLRHPDFKHSIHSKHEKHAKHEENGKYEEHDKHEEHAKRKEHGDHGVPHGQHDVPHVVKRHHHHGNKNHSSLTRQAPTRTAMTTDPTVPSTILDGTETDYLENKLLKSAFDKLVMKAEDKKIKSVKLATVSIKPINSVTDAIKLLTTTTIKPTKRKSTLIHVRKILKSRKATKTTSTTEITKTLAASSESNNVLDGQMIKRIVKLASRKKQKRRRLTETFLALPKQISTDNSKSDTSTVSPISNPCETTTNGAVLPKIARNEETLSTACVEQDDRIVCYDFKA